MWFLALLACNAGADLPPHEVVHLDTEDGLRLEADWYAGGSRGVLLLHMTPVKYDRTSWPGDFIRGLLDDGASVLVPDRRGAGGSEGEAEDAFEGPDGVLDARAAVDFLVANGVEDLSIVGASNGTTTTLDYAVTAAAEGDPVPDAIVLMSPGSYTENQHAFADLEHDRVMFTYPPEERDWPEAQRALDPGTWRFCEYEGGAHGTFLFEAAPVVAEDLRAWLRG